MDKRKLIIRGGIFVSIILVVVLFKIITSPSSANKINYNSSSTNINQPSTYDQKYLEDVSSMFSEIDKQTEPQKDAENKETFNINISVPTVPLTCNQISILGDEIYSTVRIDNINVFRKKNFDGTYDIIINFEGEKTYGDFGLCLIDYKLIDSEGYIVDSGSFISNEYSTGDKFKNWEEKIYEVKPGNYTLELYDSK